METDILKKYEKDLADYLVDIMEQTVTPELRFLFQKIRTLMNMPDCAEMYRVAIIDIVGGRIPIKEETIHKGVSFLIKYGETEIDNSVLTNEEKELQKSLSAAWLHFCEQQIILGFYQQGLLIMA